MEEIKTLDMTAQQFTRPSVEHLRQIFEQAEPCEIESARFIILDEEDIVELVINFKDAYGKDIIHAIRFAVEPAYLWSSFTTDCRLKMIQVYSEFTSHMVAEAIDDYVKRVRRATLSELHAETRKVAFNESVFRDNEFVQLSLRNIEGGSK